MSIIKKWIKQTERLSFLTQERIHDLVREIENDPVYPEFHAYMITHPDQETQRDIDLLDLAYAIASHSQIDIPHDKLVLFSGDGQKVAEDILVHHPDMQAIHTRPAGVMLEILNLFHDRTPIAWHDAYLPWNMLAARLVENTTGNITAYYQNARAVGTFRSVELGIALNNNQISTINHANKYLMQEMVTGDLKTFKKLQKNALIELEDRARAHDLQENPIWAFFKLPLLTHQ